MKINFFPKIIFLFISIVLLSSIFILVFLSLSFDSYGANSSLKTSGSETSDQQNTPEAQKKKVREISANWDGNACTLPNHSVYLTEENFVYYHSSTPIAGFQFNVEGASLISASGGEAEAAGFTTPTGNNIVLGFSLEGNTITGCGTMDILELEGKVGDLSNLVISNPKVVAIPHLI